MIKERNEKLLNSPPADATAVKETVKSKFLLKSNSLLKWEKTAYPKIGYGAAEYTNDLAGTIGS